MTVEINRLPDDIPFEKVKERVGEKVMEVQGDMGRQSHVDERLRIARDMMGFFTAKELSEASQVSEREARYKIDYWQSIGDVRAGPIDENGAIVYGVTKPA